MIVASATKYQFNHPIWTLRIKRALDVFIALFVILLICPLFLILAVAVKLSSPGPIFYRGVRAGLYGKPFRIFKFRTMVEDAESLGGPTTGTNDNRVTRIGAYMRRAKLDNFLSS